MKLIISVVFFFVLLSCSKPSRITDYKEGKQVLNMNEKTTDGERLAPLETDVLIPDTIKANEEVIARIVISNPAFILVNGLYKCNISSESLIDTANYTVDNCKMTVPTINDTIYFAFKPTKPGESEISNVLVAISKDSDKILRYHPVKFSFYVTK